MNRYLLFFLLLTSCCLGPKYKPPEITVSDHWNAQEECDQRGKIESKWWEVFDDELLTKYVQEAARSNHNVLSAKANILQARALRQVQASKLFPHISADFNASHIYFSKNGPIFLADTLFDDTLDFETETQGLPAPFSVQFPQQLSLFNALLDATWEIDLFGKIRKGIEAQDAAIGSAIEQKNDLLISIYAEIAINYIKLRSAQNLGLLLEKEIELLERKQFIEKERFKYGYNTAIDVDESEKKLFEAKSNLPKTLSEIYQHIYAISVLVGKPPESLLEELLPFQDLPMLPQDVCVGLRSDLLRRRPDVRNAERLLAQATANEGVAVASFFPSILLSGNVGFQAMKLAKLFQGRSLTWAVGGDANTPIFRGGKIIGDLKAARANTLSSFHIYEQTVLMALQEAESALMTYDNSLTSLQKVNVITQKQEDITCITTMKFNSGVINGIELLEQERQLNLAEQNSLKSQTTALTNLITLYKSLGGGFIN